jgi:hypothetical protein
MFAEMSQINFGTARKVWQGDQVYLSVIDVIAVVYSTDHRKAKSLWSTLKGRLKESDTQNILAGCQQVRLETPDGKQRLTDVISEKSLESLYWNYLYPNLRRKSGRLASGRDEVTQFHAKVALQLTQNGFSLEHHFALPSGNIIDFVGRSNHNKIIVECKTSLTRTKTYSAVGQILCYCAEYEAAFEEKLIPYIAIPASTAEDYFLNCCERLNIRVICV